MLALSRQFPNSIYISHEKELGILKTNERKYIQVVLTGVQLGPKGSPLTGWNQVLLDKEHWVYVWVDGIYSGLQTESQMPNNLFFRVVLVLHLRFSFSQNNRGIFISHGPDYEEKVRICNTLIELGKRPVV